MKNTAGPARLCEPQGSMPLVGKVFAIAAWLANAPDLNKKVAKRAS
jgi:hypothetical protein